MQKHLETIIGICLPSYNESDNIKNLINNILSISKNIIICVVDDNSPDETFRIVSENFQNIENVHIIKREKKDGRGSAVWDGFKFLNSLSKNINIYVEMDCDFSHSIEDLRKGIQLKNDSNCDVLLGSRYPDGTIINWPINRRIFSFISNMLIRTLIDKSIHDYTNGFRFYNKKAIDIILEKKPINKGFIYLSETLCFFLIKGLKIKSFPIIFKNRIRGKSNTNLTEIFNSLKGIIKIHRNFKKWKV